MSSPAGRSSRGKQRGMIVINLSHQGYHINVPNVQSTTTRKGHGLIVKRVRSTGPAPDDNGTERIVVKRSDGASQSL